MMEAVSELQCAVGVTQCSRQIDGLDSDGASVPGAAGARQAFTCQFIFPMVWTLCCYYLYDLSRMAAKKQVRECLWGTHGKMCVFNYCHQGCSETNETAETQLLSSISYVLLITTYFE